MSYERKIGDIIVGSHLKSITEKQINDHDAAVAKSVPFHHCLRRLPIIRSAVKKN
ncbi:MAG: hypothetical protein FWE67_02190 [Planctomycetaceae bacterium]|nr:hypothetical protein [Planctomycetaceae bacterium]